MSPCPAPGTMRAYGLLLRLYPVSFRREYADEMAAVFARDLKVATGVGGRAAVWARAAADILGNAAAVHGDLLRADLKYAARALSRTPGFAVTAALIVALGVAATTAAFTVTDFVLLRPLPFRAPGRLVKIWERPTGYSRMELSPANFRDWKAEATTLAGWSAFAESSFNMLGAGEPLRVNAASVSADLMGTLGVQPLIGRAFTAADDRDGAPGTVLLGYRFWQTTFGGDPQVIGRRLTLDREAFEVVGVMPPTFRFPTADVMVWTPLRLDASAYEDRTNTYLQTVARMRDGVSLEDVRSELRLLAARSRTQYPKDNQEIDVSVFALRDEISEQARLLVVALGGAAGCMLLIACANLANLLLTRALARRRELAVRAALGAGRERLVRQLATESAVLVGGGALIGVALAAAAVPFLARLVPANLPIASAPTLDLRVLTFGVGVAFVTGGVFGLAPVLRITRDRDLAALNEGVRAGGGAKERARSILVATEVMASIVLLASTGLLLRALWTIQRIDPGFRTDGVITARTPLPMPQYGSVARRDGFYREVLGRVRALPGVADAAYESAAPMTFRGGVWPVSVTGRPVAPTATETALLRYATPHLFSTLGVAILRGRDLTDRDDRSHPFVAVVSESFVRRYFPDRDPLGRHFTFAFADREIAGVVADIRARGLERASEPQVYLPAGQVDDNAITFWAPRDLIVRTAAAAIDPAALVPSIRAIVRQIDPELPVSDVRLLQDIVAGETASRAVQVRVIAAFAVAALVLAAIGIYGVLAFAVAQRRQEIGVRVALGARPCDVVWMVAAHSAIVGVTGAVPGVAIAYAAARSMQALLAGVPPGDPATFGAVALAAVVMTIVGTLPPAIQALRVDPITAIRAE